MELKNKVRYFDFNKVGKDYVVGDIHGCYTKLMDFLSKINFDFEKDRLFSVGDLVDRGPESLECLKLIYKPWFHSVYANHEQMMVEGLLQEHDRNYTERVGNWVYNGGSWHNFVNDKQELKIIARDLFEKVPYIIVIGKDTDKRVNIVHAELYQVWDGDDFGLAKDSDIDNWKSNRINLDILLWGRTIAQNYVLYKGIENPDLSVTYCGHTPVDEPFESLKHRFIDTGAVYAETKLIARDMTIVDIQNDLVYSYAMRSGEFIVKECNFYFNTNK